MTYFVEKQIIILKNPLVSCSGRAFVAWFYKWRWLLTVFSQLWGRCSPHLLTATHHRVDVWTDTQLCPQRGCKGRESMWLSRWVTPSHPVVSLPVGLSPHTVPRYRSFIVPLSWFSCLVFRLKPESELRGQDQRQMWERERVKKKKMWKWLQRVSLMEAVHQNVHDLSIK